MPSINFNLNDVKQLPSVLGLGQAPSTTAPPVNALPVPPMPLKPLPAQAGFGPWISDPATLKKVTDAITPPGQSILPAAPPAPGAYLTPPPVSGAAAPAAPAPQNNYTPPPFASGAAPAASSTAPAQNIYAPPPPSGAAALPTTAPTPEQAMQAKMSADQAANPKLYQQPGLVGQGWKGFLRYGIPAALMSAGSGLSDMGRGDPTAGYKLLGAQVAHDEGVPAANLAQYNARNVQPVKDAAALAEQGSLTAQRNAAANKSDSQADLMTPFTMTKEQATAINQPDLAGTPTTLRDYNKVLASAGNNNTSAGNNAATNANKVTTTGMNNTTSSGNNAANNTARQAIAVAANKTKMLVAQMHDATSAANNANTNANKGGGAPLAGGGFKVPADVTKRAALASNVLENADAVKELLAKRPDIVGAAGGRYSNVQQMIGSDDPDIQALGVRMHNIALASNGAHGVRAQQAIQKTEDELFSNFKAGPNAIGGALDATRGSMQTFLNDENNFATTGRRAGNIYAPPAASGSGNGGGNSVKAPDGTVHSFPNAAAAAQFKKVAGIQ